MKAKLIFAPALASALAPILAPLLASALLFACSSNPPADDPNPGDIAPLAPDPKAGPPVVVGTVIEAASGAPVAGATILGPDGSETVTDEAGRFRLKGLPPGASGDLKASAGLLEGSVRLRPLTGGRLEVVLHVR